MHNDVPLWRHALISCALVLGGANFNGIRAEEPLPQIERLQSSPVLRHLQPNPAPAPLTAAERTISQMHVPSGFRAEVIAAEPEVHQPIAFAIDERGRLWVLEAYSYPTKRPAGEGLDKVVIFSDEDGNGSFEKRHVFTEGLNLASGIEVGHGGVWIGAAPELLFIPDRDRDDKPDGPPQVMVNGFGYQDTHETLNSFLWGPDGWLYGIQGVFNTARVGKPETPEAERPELRAGVWRYHPIRHEFEIFAHGGSNPWGLDYDERGQLFMTHCRSYWGRGPTTHVIQNGHFWNQVNANYAPFIIANPPGDFPEFRNYLLASARYGHGAGGAGPRGSDAIYGGHSHVGAMIYLGDNWPEQYRGHLFTHNLGGHQINQQVNKPLGSGFDTVHAGEDVLFCTDPKYVAVDLQYGPDGAVYFIDWYDQQHCHNPNTERWERGSGRIYRMQWDETFEPAKADLGAKGNVDLVGFLNHPNHWYRRTAIRLLHERANAANDFSAPVAGALRNGVLKDADSSVRLYGLWTLHLLGGLGEEDLSAALNDPDPFVRGWAVQLAAEGSAMASSVLETMTELARNDPSPVVRRYLASVLPELQNDAAWKIAEALARHSEDAGDRNLPYLLWTGMAPLIEHDLDRAFDLARNTRLPQLTEWIHCYAATLGHNALNRSTAALRDLTNESLRRRLSGLWLAMEPRANVPMPEAWPSIAAALYRNPDVRVQRLAERLAAAFGDTTAFPRLRETLADQEAEIDARQHAFAVLNRARDPASLPVFLNLLDEKPFRSQALELVARFDAPGVANEILGRFDSFDRNEQGAALGALASRASFALALLDAVAKGTVARDQLTAYHIRQLTNLRDPEVDQRVAKAWGRINTTHGEKQARIDTLETIMAEAPLWAYSERSGREHFNTLCAQCHRLGDAGVMIGPDLTGAGKHGARYFIENIVDPDAVIGTDFQATTVETKDGDVLSGLLASETATALTLRTVTGERIVPKTDIAEQVTSEKSMMPEGLLEALNDRQQIELLKFLITN